jgi:hypothetical protein
VRWCKRYVQASASCLGRRSGKSASTRRRYVRFFGVSEGDRLVMRPLYFDAPATQGALDFLLVRPLLVGMDLWDREALTGRGLRERSLLSAGR